MTHDPTLFAGTAPFYRHYRERYDPVFVEILRRELELDGTGRLLDVGTGTGNVAVPLAPLYDEVVALDPDPAMLAEAAAEAAEAGVSTIIWVQATAEQLPLDLGRFRTVTFGQVMHWVDRPRTVATVHAMLEDGGAAVVVNNRRPTRDDADTVPWEEFEGIVRRYLGEERRAGSGVYQDPGPPEAAFVGSAFKPVMRVTQVTDHVRERTVDDVLGMLHSMSWAATRLFGDRLADFQRDVVHALLAARPDGRFPYVSSDVELLIYRR